MFLDSWNFFILGLNNLQMTKISFKNRTFLDLCLIGLGIIGLSAILISILLRTYVYSSEAIIMGSVFFLVSIWAGTQPREEKINKLDDNNHDILDSDFMK